MPYRTTSFPVAIAAAVAVAVLAGCADRASETAAPADVDTPATVASSHAEPEPTGPAEPEDIPSYEIPQPVEAAPGQPVEDGGWTIAVQGVTCGIQRIDSEVFVPSVPQGQYCRLTLNITNASDFPATIDTIGAYLYDGQQRQFALDSEATTTANSDREVGPYEELNPGMAVTYDVVYDLPADAAAAAAEVYGGGESPGFRVPLTPSTP